MADTSTRVNDPPDDTGNINAAIRASQNPPDAATGFRSVRPDIPGAGEKELSESISKAMETYNQTEKAIKDASEQQMRLANQRTPTPAMPQLQNYTKPPHEEFQDTLQVFKSPAVILAALGSLMTRQPMTAALNAGAAAMESFHKGDQENMKLHMDQWKAATELASKQNELELKQYDAAWKQYDASVADRKTKMLAIASGIRDEVMLGAIASNRVEMIEKVLEPRYKAAEAFARMKEQEAHQEKLVQMRNEGRGGSPEARKSIADSIISGEQPPVLTGLYGQSAGVRAELAEKHFDLAQAQMDWERGRKQMQSLNGPQMERFVGLGKAVINTIDEVKSLASEMNLKNIPAVNRIELQAYIQAQGDTPNSKLAVRYMTAVNTLKEEFANLANGGYAPTEPAWKLADQQINGNYSVGKLDASIDEAKRLINYRLHAFPNVDTMGPGATNRYIPGAGASQASGRQRESKTINGKTYYKENGQWYDEE